VVLLAFRIVLPGYARASVCVIWRKDMWIVLCPC